MSNVPSFGTPASLIFVEVAQGLKNHVFTGVLAQHVASELRMRFCSHRLQTHRNTPSRFKIDFLFFKYNEFFVITDL